MLNIPKKSTRFFNQAITQKPDMFAPVPSLGPIFSMSGAGFSVGVPSKLGFAQSIPTSQVKFAEAISDGPRNRFTGAGLIDFLQRQSMKRELTGLKNFAGKVFDRNPTKRRQRPGEKHAMLRIPQARVGFANYLGPGTRLAERLKAGDPPRSHMDKVAMAHDLRLALGKPNAESRLADVMTRTRMSRTDPRNNRLNPIENAELARKNIMGAEDLGEKALRELAMQGFGPADILKKKILRGLNRKKRGSGFGVRKRRSRRGKTSGSGLASLGFELARRARRKEKFSPFPRRRKSTRAVRRVGSKIPMTPGRIVRLLANKFMPLMIHRFKRGGFQPTRQFGGKLKTAFRKRLLAILREKRQKGRGVGAIISTAATLIPAVIPLVKKAGKAIWNFFKKLFSRKKKRGKGLVPAGGRSGYGLKLAGQGSPINMRGVLKKILGLFTGDVAKFLKGIAQKAIERLSGRGIGSFFKNLFKGAVALFKKLFKKGKRIAKRVKPIVKKAVPIVKELLPEKERKRVERIERELSRVRKSPVTSEILKAIQRRK